MQTVQPCRVFDTAKAKHDHLWAVQQLQAGKLLLRVTSKTVKWRKASKVDHTDKEFLDCKISDFCADFGLEKIPGPRHVWNKIVGMMLVEFERIGEWSPFQVTSPEERVMSQTLFLLFLIIC